MRSPFISIIFIKEPIQGYFIINRDIDTYYDETHEKTLRHRDTNLREKSLELMVPTSSYQNLRRAAIKIEY